MLQEEDQRSKIAFQCAAQAGHNAINPIREHVEIPSDDSFVTNLSNQTYNSRNMRSAEIGQGTNMDGGTCKVSCTRTLVC